jgi:hypothetical protein
MSSATARGCAIGNPAGAGTGYALHKRDADAAPFKALEESAFSAGVIGLRRELAADLVASAGQQMVLRLSARIVAIGFCR